MATDNSLAVESAIITHLASFAPLTALVPAASIYGVRPPAQPGWPFIRYGMPIVRPYDSSCWSGADNVISIHAFAEGPDRWPVGEIVKQIVEAMKTLSDPVLSFIGNEWTSTTTIPDNEEGSNWHAIVNFELTAIEVA